MLGLHRVWSVWLMTTIGLVCLLANQCTPVETAMVTPELISGEQVTSEVMLSTSSTPPPTPRRPRQATRVSPALPSTPTPKLKPTLLKEVKPMTITIIYDNNAYDPRLQTAWGLACLIERDETTILFDTGGDGAVLLSNMAALGFDPRAVDVVLLSHIHGDHTGGLGSLLATGSRPLVYTPRSFPGDYKAQVRIQTDLVETDQAVEIINGVYSTGEMGSGIIEQALVLKTTKGLVVVTGCAHPGIVEMVRRAKEVGGDEIFLVLGGFHLGGASKARIAEIIAEFQRLGVQKVAPCHCTGDRAIGLFDEVYGENFIQSGVGKILVFN